MLSRLIILIALVIPITGISSSVHAYSYVEGRESYDSGNYYKAFRQWYVLARKGNAKAKVGLARILIFNKIKGAKESDAHRYLNEIKDKNLPEANFLWGVIHRDGLGVERDEGKALEIFDECAAEGNTECTKAAYNMRRSSPPADPKDKRPIKPRVEQGPGDPPTGPARTPSPPKKPPQLESIKRCAAKGDRECQFFLYQELVTTDGLVSKSAQGWLKRSANNGHPGAQIEYGKLFQEQGDNNEAVKYLKMVQANPDANKEQKAAAANLERRTIYTYEDGKKLFEKGDCSGAMKIWEGLFESSSDSAHKLGEIHEQGTCDSIDISKARTYYSSALKQGHTKAALSLCRVYTNEGTIGGIDGVKAYEACVEAKKAAKSPKDKKVVEELIRKTMPPLQLVKMFVSNRQCKEASQVVSGRLAESQESEDLLYAGEFYLGDVCTTKNVQTIDVPKAKMLLSKLRMASNSKTTNAKAAHSLGIIAYFTGSDRIFAQRYFTRAKDAGVANAYYYLGLIEGAGPCGLRDPSCTLKYSAQKKLFQKGVGLGDAQSMLGLTQMYMDGKMGLFYNSGRALALVHKAEKKNHRDAYYYLAKAHEEEWENLTSDRSLQTGLYQKSANLGSVLGTHYLCVKNQSLPHCERIISHPFASKYQKMGAQEMLEIR